MDAEKCRALKDSLAAAGDDPIVSIERFFDGNDDAASIGCNLDPHPGMSAFRSALLGLVARPDVTAVHARIAEVDPGDEYWPFCDTVFVVGTLSLGELQRAVTGLDPTTVADGTEFAIPDAIKALHPGPVLAVFWD